MTDEGWIDEHLGEWARADRNSVLELCEGIAKLDRELDARDSALVTLLGGNVNPGDAEADRLSADRGIPGLAWALHGNIESGSWSGMVLAAAALESALQNKPR